MSLTKPHSNRWRVFAGEMIVPVLLCGYATYYYLSVAQLPRPQTNLLLIGPVYWILIISSVLFMLLKLREAVHTKPDDATQHEASNPNEDDGASHAFKSAAFIVLTVACVWLIPILGFAATITGYTLAILLALGARSLVTLLVTPVLLSGLLWAGMELFLNLRLPKGIFF